MTQLKYRIKGLACLLCAGWLSAATLAAQPDSQLSAANAAYEQKDFEKAMQGYEALLGAGYDSPELHYNLANAAYRAQLLGTAILHYEKAHLRAPSDADIQHNLSIARQQQANDMAALPEFFLTRWWRAAALALPAAGWAACLLLCLWAGVAAAAAWLLAPQRRQRKLGFLAGFVLLVFGLFTGLLAYTRQGLTQHNDAAIVMAQNIALRSAPESSQTVADLHEGLKVQVLDAIGGWAKVRLPNGEVGWLPKPSIAHI